MEKPPAPVERVRKVPAVSTPTPQGFVRASPHTARTMTEYTTVSIPKDLAERVDETIEGTSFSSTSDLVRFLLRSIVIQYQREGELTEAQFEDIAEQLADLGYLDR
jgi:Arc/MetJ-type ribon-helix-helix transcriptional regulator